MRKIMLAASAAAMVGGVAMSASAQTPAPMAAPAMAPTATTITPGRAAWVGSPFTAVPGPTNVPGTVQVYLRGFMAFTGGVVSDSYNTAGGNKQAPYTFGAYARIYPSLAGTTANGLNYGAYMEVRQNSGGASYSGNTGGNTLIFRRETGYVGGNWGTVRFGQTDNPIGLFTTGTFENFGDNWNGDMPSFFTQNTVPAWNVPENSGNYGGLKVVYLSPRFAGFDGGVSFQPNNVTSGEPGCTASAGPIATPTNCERLSSFPGAPSAATIQQLQRERNQASVVGRYTGAFGAVGIVATAGGIFSNPVTSNYSGPGAGTIPKFQNTELFDGGIQFTFGGLAVGGHVDTGKANGNGSNASIPVQQGGPNMIFALGGASYAVGPFLIGASYFNDTLQGAVDSVAQYGSGANFGLRKEWGVAAGGTYAWAPGTTLSLTYMYGQRHQANYNFLADTRGGANNNTRAQGVSFQNTFVW